MGRHFLNRRNGLVLPPNVMWPTHRPFVAARSFDGSAAYLEITPDWVGNMIDGASALTVAAWVYLDPAWSADGTVLWVSTRDVSSPAKVGLSIEVLSTRKVRIAGRSVETDAFQSKSSVTALSTERWYHVLGVLDIAGDTIRVYIDGIDDTDGAATVTFGNTSWTVAATGNGFDRIGGTGGAATPGALFKGALCDMAVYRRALAGSEITALAGGARPDQVSGLPPILYWPLDDETDLRGRSGFPRVGGNIALNDTNIVGDTAGFDVAKPSGLATHSDIPTERKFQDMRVFRLKASDAASVGDGGAVTSLPLHGAGVNVAFTDVTHHLVSGRSVLRFNGSSSFGAVNVGKIDPERGVAYIATINADNGNRIVSLSASATNEISAFAITATNGFVISNATPAFSFDAFTDYTVGVTGRAVLSGRYSGNQVANWLNGVRRNGTVTAGTELSNGDFLPTNFPSAVSSQLLQIGRRLHSTTSLYADMDLHDLIIVIGSPTDEEMAYLEGVSAHENDSEDVLDAGHTYKSTAPAVTDAITHVWGGPVIARSPRPRTKFMGSPSIIKYRNRYWATFNFFGDESNRTRIYVSDNGATWRPDVEFNDTFFANMFLHPDGTLYMVTTDRLNGNMNIKRASWTGDKVAWSTALLSTGTLKAAAGLTTTPPNYYPGGPAGVLFHDGKIFVAWQNATGSAAQFVDYDTFVIYADDDANLLSEASWTATAEYAIGATGLLAFDDPNNGNSVGMIEPNLVVDGTNQMWMVARVAGSRTPDKAVFIPMNWNGTTLTFPTWDSGFIRDFPGGNVQFDLEEYSGSFWSIVNDNTAEARNNNTGADQDQRNHVVLTNHSTADLSSVAFAAVRTILNETALQAASGLSQDQSVFYHGVQYASFLNDAGVARIAYRIGWSGSKDRHDSNLIGFASEALSA